MIYPPLYIYSSMFTENFFPNYIEKNTIFKKKSHDKKLQRPKFNRNLELN